MLAAWMNIVISSCGRIAHLKIAGNPNALIQMWCTYGILCLNQTSRPVSTQKAGIMVVLPSAHHTTIHHLVNKGASAL